MTVLAAQTRLTFESFSVCDANDFAFRAARCVARDPGAQFNPVLLHGPANAGKTHLLYAVADALRASGRERVILTDGRAFANDYRRAKAARDLHAFRAKYANCAALLVDDVHAMLPSIAAARQLGALAARLHARRAQVVFTSSVWDRRRRTEFWRAAVPLVEWTMIVGLAPIAPSHPVL